MGDRRKGVQRASSARRIVVTVVALFLALQGLASIVSSFARFAHDDAEPSLVASLLGATCSKHASADKETPASGVHHSQCCGLCGACGGRAPLPCPAQIGKAILPALSEPAPANRQFVNANDARPPGWASAWSQQAPPSFS
jgi:hypothetical protein